MALSNGGRFEGDFVDGQLNGQGVMQLPGGHHYEGALKNDKRHGHGILDLPGNMSCEGEWQESKLIGVGEAWVKGLRQKCHMEGDIVVFTD